MLMERARPRARIVFVAALLGVTLGCVPPTAAADAAACLRDSGDAVTRCLVAYVEAVDRCRRGKNAGCEAAARSPMGAIDHALGAIDGPVTASCDRDAALMLGFFDADDVDVRGRETCKAYGEDLLAHTSPSDRSALAAGARRCAKAIPAATLVFQNTFVKAFAARCTVPAFEGTPCDRRRRDRKIARARTRFRRAVTAKCRKTFDDLGLVDSSAAPTTEGRIDVLVDLVGQRLHRFTQRAYPPSDIGPTALPGPYPAGVRTFELFDPTRLNVQGTGPRPVTMEVYYPSTTEAVVGVPQDPVTILGFPIAPQPAYRDVPVRTGTFPLVVYSHGYQSIRVAAATLATHLASHGFIVVAPEHHGGDLLDLIGGLEDPFVYENFPDDDKFAIDHAFAWNADPASFIAGAIDESRVAVVGQQLGAHAALALSGGETIVGTFTDSRVKAIVPQVPIITAFPASFFATMTRPTLFMAATRDSQTLSNTNTAFDEITASPLVAEAVLVDGGYNSFVDVCEIPLNLRVLIDPSGEAEACAPFHLPWRYARQISDHLILSFLDGVLNGNVDALARLEAARIAAIEDVTYRRK